MNARTRTTIIFVAIAIVGIGALLAVSSARSMEAKESANAQQLAAKAAKEQVGRGEYLVRIGGCNDCHTPFKMGPNGPEPDMSRMLSGHPENFEMGPAPNLGKGPWMWAGAATNTAFAGPWGVSYARNLTPEKLTGIGIWNEELFIRTIRTGRHWGVSRPILPPMPWQNYAGATDEDLKAIFAYLRSIKPVKNQVPDAVLAP